MRKLISISILVVLAIVFNYCSDKFSTQPEATYVGSDKCQSCHKNEFELYSKSDHFHAMDTVSENSVKGDFNNTRFIYQGDTAYFFKEGTKFLVRTTDSTGEKKVFQISYTFGWQPLQQYLVKFEDGRIQSLPFCWDTRPKEIGGQRWFHLYGNEKISHTDELFWMGINQNWNYMCADCHTTDFKTNFNVAENTFSSHWAERRVSCESCHGAASNHIRWTENKNTDNAFKGFAVNLAAKQMKWKENDRQTLIPVEILKHDTLIEICAKCHARATRISDDYKPGQSFLQTHIPALLDTTNYFIDGQIKQEDYEYGSFLQSKMYANGVTCINCHDPHSMKIKFQGNTLCGSCHQPAKYDGTQHSFHALTSTGNQCVNCHMPTTKYMGVDKRLDHSIRIPRPDLSLVDGTPNACTKCHTDKPVKWAAENFAKRHKSKLPNDTSNTEMVRKITRLYYETEPSLFSLLNDKKNPDIHRATAMEQFGSITTPRIKSILIGELESDNPLLRLNALKALHNYPLASVINNIYPLLFDNVRTIRHEAMILAAPYNAQLPEREAAQFKQVMNEYLKLQEQMSHRPEGYFNRAILMSMMGNTSSAEQLYLESIKRFPGFLPSYNNLTDMYRQQGNEAEAKKTIDMGLQKNPFARYLHYALALWHIRNKNKTEGLKELAIAAKNEPANSQIVYGYAIGLFSYNEKEKAIKQLEAFATKYGNHLQILEGLISMNQDMGRPEKAAKYSSIKQSLYGN